MVTLTGARLIAPPHRSAAAACAHPPSQTCCPKRIGLALTCAPVGLWLGTPAQMAASGAAEVACRRSSAVPGPQCIATAQPPRIAHSPSLPERKPHDRRCLLLDHNCADYLLSLVRSLFTSHNSFAPAAGTPEFKVQDRDINTSAMSGSPTGERLIAVPLRRRCMRARRPNLAVPSASA